MVKTLARLAIRRLDRMDDRQRKEAMRWQRRKDPALSLALGFYEVAHDSGYEQGQIEKDELHITLSHWSPILLHGKMVKSTFGHVCSFGSVDFTRYPMSPLLIFHKNRTLSIAKKISFKIGWLDP